MYMMREAKASNIKLQRGLQNNNSHACLLEQNGQDDFTGMEKLRDKLSIVLQNIQKEKEEEQVIVDIWCHFGHAYITKVNEGE